MSYDYKTVTEDVETKNFLDKKKILETISEEDIFEMVFGFKPKEFEYVTSPFREDTNPGCWFEYSVSGRLKFIDWAGNYVVNGSKVVSMDCFNAVQLYYDLPNFYKTLSFIHTHLIEGENIIVKKKDKQKRKIKEKSKTTILIETRDFNSQDAKFWKKYGISSQNLKEDKVFAVKKYQILKSENSNKTIRAFGLSYAYTDFAEGKKKIYSPYASKTRKFITNCGKEDIGGFRTLEKGDKLIISKSYKDYRVLKNQKYQAIWFQNEGMFPTPFTLLPVFSGFKEIIVFFDNDRAGIDASEKLVKYLIDIDKTLSVKSVCLPDYPKIKDPSDLVWHKGEKELKEFLKKEI